MALLPKNQVIKLDEDLKKIIQGVELLTEQKRLLRVFSRFNLKDYIPPPKYINEYGIKRTSLTAALLEHYHQLRLKDCEVCQ